MRGFEAGKIGPVDQGDYVGGNYASALNFEAQLPNLLPEATQTDVAAFVDLGNLWSVDYDSSAGSSSKIRSSVGVTTPLTIPHNIINGAKRDNIPSFDVLISRCMENLIGGGQS